MSTSRLCNAFKNGDNPQPALSIPFAYIAHLLAKPWSRGVPALPLFEQSDLPQGFGIIQSVFTDTNPAIARYTITDQGRHPDQDFYGDGHLHRDGERPDSASASPSHLCIRPTVPATVATHIRSWNNRALHKSENTLPQLSTKHDNSRPRTLHGFTLVELLVVTGLMAVFFGLIVSGLRPTEDSEVRSATQGLVSSLIRSQTLALSKPDGFGLLLKTSTETAGISSASGATFAAPQPAILTTATSLVTASPSGPGVQLTGQTHLSAAATLSGTQASVGLAIPENADNVADAYRIRFGVSTSGADAPATFGRWLAFEATSDLSGVVTFLGTTGQTESNTVWPIAYAPSLLRCQIARRPETTETAVAFSKNVAIDMRYSGVGDDPYVACSAFDHPINGSLGDIALLFGMTGGIDAVIPANLVGKSGLDPTKAAAKPTAPIYLLVTPRSLIDANASCLRTQRTVWIAISPSTGRVLTGKNTPQSSDPPTLASSGNSKETYTAAYRAYFQNARQQVRRLDDTSTPK